MRLYELEIGSWFYDEYGKLCILKKKMETGICIYYSSDEGSGIETRQDAIGFPLTERNKYISDWILWWRKRLSDEGLLEQETDREIKECLISLMEIEDNLEEPRNWAFQEPYRSIRSEFSLKYDMKLY